jgi:hypothetical protein
LARRRCDRANVEARELAGVAPPDHECGNQAHRLAAYSPLRNLLQLRFSRSRRQDFAAT